MNQFPELDRGYLRRVLLFMFRSGKSAAAAHREIVDVYGQDALSYRTTTNHFERFRSGDFSFTDRPRSGRPSELDLDALRTEVETNPYHTSRSLAEALHVSHTTTLRGLESIGKVSKLGRWVPHELSDSQKNVRVTACTSMISLFKHKRLLPTVITGDEKWVMYVNIVRKRQWVDKGEPADPVPKPDLHPKKLLLCCFWCQAGMEWWELLKPGNTITADKYCNQLRELKAHLLSTRGQQAKITFLHDNARPHTAKATKSELQGYGWLILAHPPYSPDIAPSDYHLFSHLQRHLDGRKFRDETEVRSELTSFFASQPPSFWEEGISNLPRRWQEVVDADGAYIH